MISRSTCRSRLPQRQGAEPKSCPRLDADLREAPRIASLHAFLPFHGRGRQEALFLSDMTASSKRHMERLVESAGPCRRHLREQWTTCRAAPVAGRPQGVVKWLKTSSPRALSIRIPLTTLRFRTSRHARIGWALQAIPEGLLSLYSCPFQVTFSHLALRAGRGEFFTREGRRSVEPVGTVHSPVGCPSSFKPYGLLHGLRR